MTTDGIRGEAREGVRQMEREHALEIQMVRDLQSALAAGDRATASSLFDRLEDFTNAHFLGEQLVMRLHHYSGFAAHQEEHDRLVGELRELRRLIESGDALAPVAAAARLERWLFAHMSSEDGALQEFLTQQDRGEGDTPARTPPPEADLPG